MATLKRPSRRTVKVAPVERRKYSISLSTDVHLRARRTVVDFAGQEIETTVSGLIEIGLVELLRRKDLAAVLQSHDARARRH
jgi:hypothetical protein